MNQPFCSPVQALRSVLDAAALLPSPSPETIPLEAACGRIAASDIESGSSDEDEADFTEVFEYVRVGVLLLQSELTAITPGTTRH